LECMGQFLHLLEAWQTLALRPLQDQSFVNWVRMEAPYLTFMPF